MNPNDDAGSQATGPPLAISKQPIHVEIKLLLATYYATKSPGARDPREIHLLSAVDILWTKEEKKQGEGNNPREKTLETILKKMQASIEKLEKKAEDTPRSYAGAAASGQRGDVNTSTAQTATNALENKHKLKTLVVRVNNQKEAADLRLVQPKDALDRIQRALGTRGDKVAAIWRLPSGDLELHMAAVEDKEWMKQETAWTKVVAASAAVVRRSDAVMAHGVRVANVDTTNQGEAIKKLTLQNNRIHTGLRIAGTKKAIDTKMPFSSLIIELDSPAMVNPLLREGLVEEPDLKTCKVYSKECRLTQCFNCQQYGHIGRICRKMRSLRDSPQLEKLYREG